jgi:hypothetical protein
LSVASGADRNADDLLLRQGVRGRPFVVSGALGARADQGEGELGMTTTEDVLRLEYCFLTQPTACEPVLNVRVEGSEVLHRYVLTYKQLIALNAQIGNALQVWRVA